VDETPLSETHRLVRAYTQEKPPTDDCTSQLLTAEDPRICWENWAGLAAQD